MTDPLKLRAEDEEDLAVVSAILQDALVAVGEMAWLPEEKRFVLVANRFRWEPPTVGPSQDNERRMSGLRVDGVISVQRRGFAPRDSERLLVLLAIRPEAGALFLDFAGGSSIRLEVERILCHLDDLGEPWPTRWRPRHPVEDDAG
jgi:Protein of unknown function (DUF2948)